MHCYLCRNSTELFLKKNGYSIYRCPSCGLAQTDLKTNYDDFVRSFYTKGYYSGDETRSAYVSYRDDKKFIVANMRKFLHKVKQYKRRGKLLDVGCAFGYFVELALHEGYDAYGFDASHFAVEQAQKLVGKERIRQGTIQDMKYPEKSFDVITLFDVFEHLHDPGADLGKLRTLLKDDGVMIIATGDTESVMARVLKRRWTFYIPPQHLFFFNKTTLTRLLHTYGLKPFEWFRIGKLLSLRYVLHLARTTGESAIAHHLYNILPHTHRIPIYLPVGDNMVTVIKKTNSVSTIDTGKTL